MGKIKVRIISMITILCMMISAIEFDSFAQTQEKTLALEQMDAGEDDSLFTVSCGDENFVNEETPVDEEDLESDDNIETYSEEELPDYVILQDDVYVNTCENFSETRSYEGYEFSNIRFTMSNGMAYFKGTVKNNTGAATEVCAISIIFYDKDGEYIGKWGGVISPMESGGTCNLSASSTLGQQWIRAYDYEIIRPESVFTGQCGDELSWTLNGAAGTLEIEGSGTMWNYEGANGNHAPWYNYAYGKKLSLKLDEGITSIGNYAFENISFESEIVFPESLKKISSYGYEYCNFVGNINIPNNINEIEASAFRGCSFVESETGEINIGNGVLAINEYSFDINGAKMLRIGKNVTLIEDYAFVSCDFEGGLKLPENLERIGKSAFQDSKFSGELELPLKLKEIGENAFYYSQFAGILLLPGCAEKIGNQAFRQCEFEEVYIPEGITNMQWSNFNGAIIWTPSNSYAANWATINNVEVREISASYFDENYNNANIPNVYIPLLDNILNKRYWIIETIVDDNPINNPYAIYAGCEMDEMANVTAVTQLSENTALAALVGLYDSVTNIGDVASDVTVGMLDEIAKDLTFVFDENASLVVDDFYQSRKEKRIQGALQNIVDVTYISEELESSLGSDQQSKSIIEECRSIIGKSDEYKKAAKSTIDLFNTGSDIDLQSKMLEYTNEYVPLLTDKAISYLEDYVKTYKYAYSEHGRVTAQKKLYQDLNDLGYLKSISYDEEIIKEWKLNLDTKYFASRASKILTDAEKALDTYTTAMNVWIDFENMISDAEEIAALFNHLAESTPNGSLKNEIKQYSLKVIRAGDERIVSTYDGLMVLYKNGVFSGVTDYVEEKIQKKIKSVLAENIGVYSDYLSSNVLAYYNAAKFAISFGSFVNDKTMNTASIVDALLEIQIDQEIIEDATEMFYKDLKEYKANPSEEQAKIVLDDLDLIKKTKMQQMNLAYEYNNLLITAPAESVLATLRSSIMGAETVSEAELEAYMNTQRNVLMVCSIYSISWHGSEPLQMEEEEFFNAGIGFQPSDKLLGGVICPKGTTLFFPENHEATYIPYVQVDGADVTIAVQGGEVVIGQLVLNGGNLNIIGNVKVDSDVFFPGGEFTLNIAKGGKLEIYGNCNIATAKLNVQEKANLYVENDLIGYKSGNGLGGYFYPHVYWNGNVTINGNVKVEGPHIYMQNDNAYVMVKGNFALETGKFWGDYWSEPCYMTNGVLEVKGNYLFDSKNSNSRTSQHTTIFSGNGEQTVYGIFDNVNVKNTSNAGIVFVTIQDGWLSGGRTYHSKIWGKLYVAEGSNISGSSLKDIVMNKATAICLDKTSITINKGSAYRLNVDLTPTSCGDIVTWSSTDTNIAMVSNVGTVTGISVGTTIITATTINGKSASCRVVVKNPTTKIKLNKTKVSITKGKTYTLKATLTPSDTTDTIKWTSSNKKIATVSSKGKITAIKKGTVTITAKTSSGKKATCKVTVKEIAAKKIKLNKTSVTLKKGKSITLKATLTPKNSTDTIKWSSSNKKIAKVSNKGKVTAVKKGKATITAKTSGGKTVKCKVTVK